MKAVDREGESGWYNTAGSTECGSPPRRWRRSASPLASTPPAFEDYFEPRTLRVDLVRAGTAEEDAWSLLRLTAEGAWAGPRQHLLDPHDLGGLRVALIEPQSGQRVYSRGFSSLFDEWQTTAEAGQGRRRAMVETLRLPLPRIAMELVIEARGEQGFARVFRWPLDPAAPCQPGSTATTLREAGDSPRTAPGRGRGPVDRGRRLPRPSAREVPTGR
ncbi:MAG: peptidase M64 N-terminal domain-containing protein [Acidobacteriota bacterium]|nr:peptidase M64 N-terminal domain-containing protein [Acidobacteriota bacterium]